VDGCSVHNQKKVSGIARRRPLGVELPDHSVSRLLHGDLPIPDQRKQIEAWCAARKYTIVSEFVEAGASTTDDKRPEFQKLIDLACNAENRVDAVICAFVFAVLSRLLWARVLAP
jgi:Resolvase, N terminal domain